mgnify:CR=1 FL=1
MQAASFERYMPFSQLSTIVAVHYNMRLTAPAGRAIEKL